MNIIMLEILQGNKSLYPYELEKQYRSVMNKIIELWYTPGASAYFHNLTIADQDSKQQAFPPEVAIEIFRLSQEHERTCTVDQLDDVNPWLVSNDRDLQTRDMPVTENRHLIDINEEFFKSIEAGDEAVFTKLGSHGIDLNWRDEHGRTSLIAAVSCGHEKIVEFLIRKGVDIEAVDKAGYTALHWAAFNGHTHVLKLLLDHNADPNALSMFGWTPLMQAATHGHLVAIKLLVAAEGNVNLSSDDGWTPLHKATANGHIEVVRFLLENRANRNKKLQNGSTALDLAMHNENAALIAVLRGDE